MSEWQTRVCTMRPFVKPRPKFMRGKPVYASKSYKQARTTLWALFRAHGPVIASTGQLELALVFRFKAKGPNADIDNLAGGVMDSLNGLLYDNDRQVWHLTAKVERMAGSDEIEISWRPAPAA